MTTTHTYENGMNILDAIIEGASLEEAKNIAKLKKIETKFVRERDATEKGRFEDNYYINGDIDQAIISIDYITSDLNKRFGSYVVVSIFDTRYTKHNNFFKDFSNIIEAKKFAKSMFDKVLKEYRADVSLIKIIK